MTTGGFTTDSSKVRNRRPANASNPQDPVWSRSRLSSAINELAGRAPGEYAFDFNECLSLPNSEVLNAIKTDVANGFTLTVADPLNPNYGSSFGGVGAEDSFIFDEVEKGFYFSVTDLNDQNSFGLNPVIVDNTFESINVVIGGFFFYDPQQGSNVQISVGDLSSNGGGQTPSSTLFTPAQLEGKEFFITFKINASGIVTVNLYTDENETPLVSHTFDSNATGNGEAAYRQLDRVGFQGYAASQNIAEFMTLNFPFVPAFEYTSAIQAKCGISIDEANLPGDGLYIAIDLPEEASSSIGKITNGAVVSVFGGILASRTVNELPGEFVEADKPVEFTDTVQMSGQFRDFIAIETESGSGGQTIDLTAATDRYKKYLVKIRHQSGNVTLDLGDTTKPMQGDQLPFMKFVCTGKGGNIVLQATEQFVINNQQIGNTYTMTAGSAVWVISSPTSSYQNRYVIIEIAGGGGASSDWSVLTANSGLAQGSNYQLFAGSNNNLIFTIPFTGAGDEGVIEFVASVIGTGGAGSGSITLQTQLGDQIALAGTTGNTTQAGTTLQVRNGERGIIFKDRAGSNRWVVALTTRNVDPIVIDNTWPSPYSISNNDFNGRLVVVNRSNPITLNFVSRAANGINKGFNFALLQKGTGKATLAGADARNIDGNFVTRGQGALVTCVEDGDLYYLAGALE